MNKSIKINASIWYDGKENGAFDGFFIANGGLDSEYFKSQGYLPISLYEVEIEMPEGIDLHKAQLTALQDKRKLILAENEKRLNAIDNEIANFLAVEDKS